MKLLWKLCLNNVEMSLSNISKNLVNEISILCHECEISSIRLLWLINHFLKDKTKLIFESLIINMDLMLILFGNENTLNAFNLKQF
jgi:hypothetical protein